MRSALSIVAQLQDEVVLVVSRTRGQGLERDTLPSLFLVIMILLFSASIFDNVTQY